MYFKKKGESIVEVLVAIVILTVVMTAAFKVLINTTKSNVDVKNRIIALNVAREGIESVRNIRDTNWFKYAGDRETKWLCHDTIADPDNCLGANLNILEDGFYTIDFDSGQNRYFLNLVSTSAGTRLDLSGPSTNVEDFHLYKKINERFTHDDDSGANPVSPFYRQIELEIPAETNVCTSPINNNCAEKRIRIISRVQWQEEENLKQTILETYLFNFYARNSY